MYHQYYHILRETYPLSPFPLPFTPLSPQCPALQETSPVTAVPGTPSLCNRPHPQLEGGYPPDEPHQSVGGANQSLTRVGRKFNNHTIKHIHHFITSKNCKTTII